MQKALKDNKTHYAPSTGVKELREAMVKKINIKNNIVLKNLRNKDILKNNCG